jgi:hypothetical protein
MKMRDRLSRSLANVDAYIPTVWSKFRFYYLFATFYSIQYR